MSVRSRTSAFRLDDIATTANNFVVANGNSWIATTGADARSRLGLGNVATLNTGTSGNTVVLNSSLGEFAYKDDEFIQTGNNAVARTYVEKLKDVVSVKDFGAHSVFESGYENFDSTPAIQAAIDAVKTRNGMVLFPAGKYNHTGIVLEYNVSISGVPGSMISTVLNNTSSNASISVNRTATSGSLLNCGISNFTLIGSNTGGPNQHGVVINGCSSGYLINYVRVLGHGGDGFRILEGNAGPCFDHIVSILNAGYGINFTSGPEHPGAINATSTSARFLWFFVRENQLGGIRMNGGAGQDHKFNYFQYGLVESNKNFGVKLLNGVHGTSMRDVWIENNEDYGIICTRDTEGVSQNPLYMMFENIYFNSHDIYDIYVTHGIKGRWIDIWSIDSGISYFEVNANAKGHQLRGGDFTLDPVGSGYNLLIDEFNINNSYFNLQPSIKTSNLYINELVIANNISTVTRSVTTTSEVTVATTYVPVSSNSISTFIALASAQCTSNTSKRAAYKVEGACAKDSTSASVKFIGTPTVTVLGETDADWNLTAELNVSTGGFRFYCTGASGLTINWFFDIRTVKAV